LRASSEASVARRIFVGNVLISSILSFSTLDIYSNSGATSRAIKS
jgi:hypothetical protein